MFRRRLKLEFSCAVVIGEGGAVLVRLSLILALFVALSAPRTARAADGDFDDEDCSEIRLDQPGGSMSTDVMPIQAQGNLPICDGYVASQMVDAYRFSHGDPHPEHRTSPLALSAMASAKRGDVRELNRGYAVSDLEFARSNGSCSQDAVRTSYGKLGTKGFTDELTKYFGEAEEYRQQAWKRGVIQDETSDSQIGRLAGDAACFLVRTGLLPDSSVALSGIMDTLGRALGENNAVQYLNTIFARLCEGHTLANLALPEVRHVYIEELATKYPYNEPRSLFRMLIHNQLEAPNPQPVGLNYCANVLQNVSFSGVGSDRKVPASCDRHWSMVIGRNRGPDGVCRFLIRNSWGTGCARYVDRGHCEENTGQIWVDENQLARSTLGLAWFGEGK